jgi:predicted RNase H-like HicB family nuclease
MERFPASLAMVRSALEGGKEDAGVRNEFTAVVERDGRWYIAYCPEIPGANGQGKTKAAALKSLSDAIALILEDRRKDGLRGIPATATREKVVVG